MNLNQGAEKLATWLRAIQAQGRPCPTNVTQSAIMVLHCSRAVANRCRRILVDSGRLVINPMQHVYKIDGHYFERHMHDEDEVAQIKTILRKHYGPVYDPRTVAHEDKVAKGEPKVLLVGTELVPFSQARDLARQIAAQSAAA